MILRRLALHPDHASRRDRPPRRGPIDRARRHRSPVARATPEGAGEIRVASPPPMRTSSLIAGLLLATLAAWPTGAVRADEPPVKLLTASFFGTEDDDIQGAAQAPDGTIYLVGNVGTAMRDLPGGVAAKVFGERAADPLTPRHRPTPDPFPARRGEKQIPSSLLTTPPAESRARGESRHSWSPPPGRLSPKFRRLQNSNPAIQCERTRRCGSR